jgi:Tfp pilus assembly protein PilN
MSKVQFNLLPDIKLEYNRTQHLKNTVMTIATLLTGASLALMILLFVTVNVVQKKQLSDSAKDVDSASQQLKNVPQIDQIITVQNQLTTLVELHQTKHITSRIFDFLPKLTPPNLTINKLDMDLKKNTMSISGKAGAQSSVNAFVDALKFANYKLGGGDKTKAFSSVVESAFTINQSNIAYTINLQFDPALFQNSSNKDGKPVAPVLSVNQPAGSSLSPSTIFNSSRDSGGSQ